MRATGWWRSARVWDVKYYSQTQSQSPPRGVYRFQSDVNLASPETETGKVFSEFAQNPGEIHGGRLSKNDGLTCPRYLGRGILSCLL